MSSYLNGQMKACLSTDLQLDGLQLPLHRYQARGSTKQSVLLLHGGNTHSGMYHERNGGLVGYLVSHGCDVWTLDWRASAAVLKTLIPRGPLKNDELQERGLFTLDRVAEQEIPRAVRTMREAGVHGDISMLGFCLGGGALSMAVARGHLEGQGVGNVVLMTMGLFYEVPWNGWLKAEDFILERMLATAPRFRAIDPVDTKVWPSELRDAYDRWPKAWLNEGSHPMDELFRRLTFMYGEPYARARLLPAFERGLHANVFGPMHVGLYLHASQMVRRGYAARFDSLDVIDRARIVKSNQRVVGEDLNPSHFRNKRVTVVTGAENRLWHRDSIDLMYEWLRNEAVDPLSANLPSERQRHRKHVLRHYGHLDLLWSESSAREVYPLLKDALMQPALASAAHRSPARQPPRPSESPPNPWSSPSSSPGLANPASPPSSVSPASAATPASKAPFSTDA